MKEKSSSEMFLTGLRALDLTDEKGFFCGRVLADLGVDVIKVEKPGGDRARAIGPFYHDVAHPEKSLYWFAYNANKRGITLDIETLTGREIFERLVRTADFLIESFPPGYLEKLGLGYPELSAIKEDIILTSITPFGETGPHSGYKASDLVLMGMSGEMYVCGDTDRAPVRISFPQSYLHAGVEAAAGTMIAYHHRKRTGEGQHVDVSMQECMIWCLMAGTAYWELNRKLPRRAGPYQQISSLALRRMIWKCKDGYVAFGIFGGLVGARNQIPLVAWMKEEGISTDYLRTIDWERFDMAASTNEEMGRIEEPIGQFFLKHTKEELYRGARERRIMIVPVSESEDLVIDEQLKARGFWIDVEHPELGEKIPYPGAFTQASGIDCGIKRRAPLIGEHNEEIYCGELGFPRNELVVLKQAGII